MLTAVLTIGALIALLLLGVPMLVAIMGIVSLNIILSGSWALTLPQSMVSGMSLFMLLALPMFLLAGGIMNAGGISGRLFDFARALVGWTRGGLAHVNVVTSMFFGGMVGSSTADLAGTGSIVIPAMKREGYSSEFSAAVTASSAGVGPMIPPSSPMILYSAVTGTSLGALFLAGLIPGILLGLTLMGAITVIARRRGWKPTGNLAWREVLQTGARSVLAFGMPIIIVAGLVFGVFTPTEGASFAVAYALIISCFVYRSLSWRDLYRIFGNAVQLTGELMLIVSLSFALGSSLAILGVPAAIGNFIALMDFGDNMFLVLLVLVGLAIIAGMILDPLIPVLVPIILPAMMMYNVDVIQFGVLMTLSVVIGQLTPPLAMALIITSRIADVDQMKIFKANLPFFFVIIGFTILVMLVPSLATWLPTIAQY
ncbi:TRAP transporter large permease [Fodinicurvata sp. EGI_FJ10296]|uniref:TRAP transporter large permease n=1 Tax=Fodinicurvata sp. EGI_FJ10296 TaxID=3231908 RepID=UPI0034539425